ncbi:MAG: ribonuclease HII [Bacteroidetes bacterium]|nr:ribonuclease HII [Bacteroidota bacterium]MDA0829033.1 ribonuclease HII [Bacteroidota bacterium]MDA1199095.1 ribonuclease HII [Bacteroidota bacterium]
MLAGVDEAGRGCLAGPVVAAAVLWPEGQEVPGLTDSKKLSEAQREKLRTTLEKLLPDGHWAVGMASAEEIDAMNILQATYVAMHRAIAALQPAPDHLLIDGNRFKAFPGISHQCEVKGDARFQAISAASIFAKTERDRLMLEGHSAYPHYGWERNKGYPSVGHRQALENHGPCPWHRRSFTWKPAQLRLDL